MKSLSNAFRSPMTWLLVLIVVAAAVVFANAGDDDEDAVDAGNETGAVEVTGDALVPFANPDTGVGATIPTVEATLLGGGSMELGPDGTGRLIGFFAHWCPHCQAEVPVARSWLDQTTLPEGVEVLAVSTAVDPSADNYPPSQWFAREDWPTPVLLDDDRGTLAAAYGLTQYPYWVAVDGNGVVVARTTGGLTATELDLLVELAAGSPVGP